MLDSSLQPIIRSPLAHNPNMLSGDDAGYRDVESCDGGEPMVVLRPSSNIIIRPVYAGYSHTDGTHSPDERLPWASEKILVRQSVQRWLQTVVEHISQISWYKLIVVDGFRDYITQASGFSWLFVEALNQPGGNMETLAAKFDAFCSADRIFSFVKTDIALLDDADLTSDHCRWLAEILGKSVTPEDIRRDLLTAAANMALYERHSWKKLWIFDAEYWDKKIWEYGDTLFLFDTNAHAGGWAVDCFLGEEVVIEGKKKIIPVNHVPFDYNWSESQIDFLEKESNWDIYREKAKESWKIRDYCTQIWIDPDNIPDEQFYKWRWAIRLLTNTMTNIGATYYCDENWHFNLPNIVRHPETRETVYESSCVSIQRNTWNSCHAVLVHGKHGIQTFTGKWAHTMV